MAVTPSEAKVIEQHFHLVEGAVRCVMKKWRLRPSLRDELESGAQLALVGAARRAVQMSDPAGYLFAAAINGAYEGMRGEIGRCPGSMRRREVLLDEESWFALEPPDPAPGPCERLLRSEAVQELLAACRDDRRREVAIRFAAGETGSEIGQRLGVSESRVNQLLGKPESLAGYDTQPPVCPDVETPVNIESAVEVLSPRQIEVLQAAVDGCNRDETAQLLRISVETVKSHRRSIIERLGVRSMRHAIRLLRSGDLNLAEAA